MTRPVYAIEVTAYDPAAEGEVLLTFASAGFCTTPTDTPANTHFQPRVIEAGNFARYLVDALVTDGRSRVGTGVVVLANAGGGLDAIAGYGLDGRALVIRRGRVGDAYPAEWETVLTGTMEQAEPTLGEVRLRIRDRQAEVADRAWQETKYAGSNSLPDGVEGVAEDLKGKPKPVLYGKVRNIAPPVVNTSKLTFQVSDREIDSLDAVYVGGLAISAGTTHASLSALQGATVGAGTYDAYLGAAGGGAFFRLGTGPDNIVTCDATAGDAAADRTAAQIATQILLDHGVDPGDIDDDSVDALDTANDAVIGFWTGTEEWRTGDALDLVLGSVGGFWAVSATGVFTLGRLEEPGGAPAVTIKRHNLLEAGAEPVERLAGRSQDRGLPAWRVNFRYRRNYTPQRGADVVAAAGQDRRAELAEEWRTVTAEDSAVRTAHPLAPEKDAYSLIDDPAEAEAEAERLLEMHGTRRDFLRVRVPPSAAEGLELGDVAELDVDRFDWAGGKLFRVTGIVNEFRNNQTTLELWG